LDLLKNKLHTALHLSRVFNASHSLSFALDFVLCRCAFKRLMEAGASKNKKEARKEVKNNGASNRNTEPAYKRKWGA